MNGRKAKALRKLARELKLPPKTQYAPVGPLRHRESREIVDAQGQVRVLQGGLVRRPFALQACARRAYQEAKAIYKGESQGITGQAGELQELVPFKTRMVNSIKAQPDGPVVR